MSRANEIRQEATKHEEYWHMRRVGAVRLAMQEAADRGMTIEQAAVYCGVSYSYIAKMRKPFGITFARATYRQTVWSPPQRVPSNIEVRPTLRETALVNRGKATAEQIALAIGVSRNSIIGHWFRARQLGQIQ